MRSLSGQQPLSSPQVRHVKQICMFRSFSLSSFASQEKQRVDVCSVMERTPTNDANCTKVITLGTHERA
jgi:hypothetical protein